MLAGIAAYYCVLWWQAAPGTPIAMTNRHSDRERGGGDQPFARCGAAPRTEAARTLDELVAAVDGVRREIGLWFPLSLGALTLSAAIVGCIAAFA